MASTISQHTIFKQKENSSKFSNTLRDIKDWPLTVNCASIKEFVMAINLTNLLYHYRMIVSVILYDCDQQSHQHLVVYYICMARKYG